MADSISKLEAVYTQEDSLKILESVADRAEYNPGPKWANSDDWMCENFLSPMPNDIPFFVDACIFSASYSPGPGVIVFDSLNREEVLRPNIFGGAGF
jgi:hypothetical protein